MHTSISKETYQLVSFQGVGCRLPVPPLYPPMSNNMLAICALDTKGPHEVSLKSGLLLLRIWLDRNGWTDRQTKRQPYTPLESIIFNRNCVGKTVCICLSIRETLSLARTITLVIFFEIPFFLFVWYEVLRPSQQLHVWSCQVGQFTLPHFFLGKLD